MHSVNIKIIQPARALNGAFRKVKPGRTSVECFKANLTELLDRRNDSESEEFHKNLVIDFLKKTYYAPQYFINTKGRNDLVIHNGDTASSAVGVILEVKRLTNKAEMLTKEKLNVKALHELILYYLRERITLNNLEVKYLIATSINEWFVFDAALFEKLFVKNRKMVQLFEKFESGQLSGTNTDFFYDQVAAPFVAEITEEIEFAYFDIRNYEKPLRNSNPKDDNKLIALFKLMSPEHLLKLPFANDSNSLDKGFYTELLHLIGLTEIKQGGKKLIQRNKEGERNTGSLLESIIVQLESLDKVRYLANPGQFGETHQERLFNVALELCITWINRILFLKLLEAQLLCYHRNDKSYEFLNLDLIKDYDDLNSLFFQVLACKHEDRNEDVKELFKNVPYLNSSLFEATAVEHETIFISNLRDDKAIPVLKSTVLKDLKGKKKSDQLNTLQYLFEFLNAFDFSSEGSEEIQEDNKTLISASVLGLIFEKINGYKDGSFFTPGCITTYMCHEALSKAVVDKFNMTKGWDCSDLNQLYDKIEDREEANEIINSLKICDPAVGSGHFLVSALNELIRIKSELRVLQDRDGRRLKEYEIDVVNDELIITDDDGELFAYNPLNKESQRVQEALFHEKQVIIENCLFGVDINPNSVKICRLRLWVELLKNSYYKSDIELETLPNIDINIKCGNSLIARFKTDADLSKALVKSKWTIDSYRRSVQMYRNAKSKDQKREMEQLINRIKSDFRSEIAWNDPKVGKLQKLTGKQLEMTQQPDLFPMSKKEKTLWNKKLKKITTEKQKLEAEIEEIKNNKVFENAFEWRFEFPEVLDNDGVFCGFDVMIGNPPYVQIQKLSEQIKKQLGFEDYMTFSKMADLYCLFYERSINLLRAKGILSFITSNKFFRAGYGKNLRKLLNENNLNNIVDFGELPVFDAGTDPCIIELVNQAASSDKIKAVSVKDISGVHDVQFAMAKHGFDLDRNSLDIHGWTLGNPQVMALLQKIRSAGMPLGEYVEGRFYYGIKTGFNDAFVINQKTREELISSDPNSAELIKPWVRGKDIRRWFADYQDIYIINIQSSSNKDWPWSQKGDDAESVFSSTYPAVCKYLCQFKDRLVARDDQGRYYWELRSCVYNYEFGKPRIMYPVIAKESRFLFSNKEYFSNDKTFILPTNNMALLGILNSLLIWFYLKQVCTAHGDPQKGGRLELRGIYMSDVPVLTGLSKNSAIEQRVETILNLKKTDPDADVSELEAEIDQVVYKLYGLTPEEIEIVEKTHDKSSA
jgi:adenine-specific DNA-methyltransferase